LALQSNMVLRYLLFSFLYLMYQVSLFNKCYFIIFSKKKNFFFNNFCYGFFILIIIFCWFIIFHLCARKYEMMVDCIESNCCNLCSCCCGDRACGCRLFSDMIIAFWNFFVVMITHVCMEKLIQRKFRKKSRWNSIY
jgi:hypothetical protein